MPTSPNLESLIRALQDPRAYPHPVAPVRVVQTHVSCVFLTGEYVYKVKKPVDFGFLDYGTLEQRLRCCQREVELNRRLCPEVYLGVVPIGWEAGRLRVGAPLPAVEWAVRMRQLPEADLLSARLAAGSVSREHIERLADLLAEFHARAQTSPEINAFGTPEAVSRNVEENFAVTEPRVGSALPRDHFEAIRDYTRRFLRERRALFLERLSAGRVRDGHGDLRAQNICLFAGLGGGIQLLDCIEFNDRFRFGDVASDLAYLAMDLDLAGRADLRQVLVDRYVACANDPGLRSILPFYACYRAHVRGKIALLMAAEPEVPPPERRSQERLAAAAFDLSRSYAERRERPALLITVGYSGSGKSALAHELARRLPAVRLASDAVRKELAGPPGASSLSPEHYTAEARKAIYGELRARARRYLPWGEHVILDATFLDPEERRQAAAVAADVSAEAWLIECRCPDPVIRRRLERRKRVRQASDAGIAVYEAQLRTFSSFCITETELSLWRRVRLRTNQPARRTARQFLREFWRAAAAGPASAEP